MRLLRGLGAGFVLGALGGMAVQNLRPAPLLAAVVGAVSGTPPLASVSLRYGTGLAPIAAEIVVFAAGAELGSATVSGTARFAEVQLTAGSEMPLMARVTLRYRVLGWPVVRVVG